MDDDWKPLNVRMGDPETGPFEGIPRHLSRVLREWLGDALGNLSRDDQIEVLLRMRLDLPKIPDHRPLDQVYEICATSFKLTIIDAVLPFCDDFDQTVNRMREFTNASLPGPQGQWNCAQRLRRLLGLGGSVWTVSTDNRSLVRRVNQTVETAVAEATSDPNAAASRHLRQAYGKAFGINPEPSTSYRKSIQAVESAAWPHVTPQNAKQTLGSMIADLRQRPEKWTVVIHSDSGVERVRSMMELLWQGQIDRHGQVNLQQVTEEAAEAAVFLAATLVQWFNSGAILRVP